jgi:hypothetical protein
MPWNDLPIRVAPKHQPNKCPAISEHGAIEPTKPTRLIEVSQITLANPIESIARPSVELKTLGQVRSASGPWLSKS